MFEYLDHTADVQIHAWGTTLEESFMEAGNALLNYMTDQGDIQPVHTYTISITAPDIHRLLYQFLDDLLYHFFVDYAAHDISISSIRIDKMCNDRTFSLEAVVRGEQFDRERHRCGCEVKAITYSNMSISLSPPYDIFVIIDI